MQDICRVFSVYTRVIYYRRIRGVFADYLRRIYVLRIHALFSQLVYLQYSLSIHSLLAYTWLIRRIQIRGCKIALARLVKYKIYHVTSTVACKYRYGAVTHTSIHGRQRDVARRRRRRRRFNLCDQRAASSLVNHFNRLLIAEALRFHCALHLIYNE